MNLNFYHFFWYHFNLYPNNQNNNQNNFTPFSGTGHSLANSETIEENFSSTTLESFPWLLDDDGRPIDFTKKISTFDAVNLLSKFLTKRYNVDPNNINLENKLSEILQTNENKNLSVLDMFNRVAAMHKKGELNDLGVRSVQQQYKDFTELTQNADALQNSKLSSEKAYGVWGDMTVNDLAVKLKDLNIENIIGSIKITINPALLLFNVISYGLIIKTYVKTVHNQPYPSNLSGDILNAHKILRMHNFAMFSLLGAPVICVLIKQILGNSFKNMFTIESLGEAGVDASMPTVSAEHSAIFLILSKINKKIPNWLKWVFRIIFISIIFLNILGYSSVVRTSYALPFLNNIFYIKIILILLCLLVIIYQLLNIFILYRFKDQRCVRWPGNIMACTQPQTQPQTQRKDLLYYVEPYAPDFLLKWIKIIRVISSTKESIKIFKKTCYVQIFLYLIIILIITFIL